MLQEAEWKAVDSVTYPEIHDLPPSQRRTLVINCVELSDDTKCDPVDDITQVMTVNYDMIRYHSLAEVFQHRSQTPGQSIWEKLEAGLSVYIHKGSLGGEHGERGNRIVVEYLLLIIILKTEEISSTFSIFSQLSVGFTIKDLVCVKHYVCSTTTLNCQSFLLHHHRHMPLRTQLKPEYRCSKGI